MSIITNPSKMLGENLFLFKDADIVVCKDSFYLPKEILLEKLIEQHGIDYILHETQHNYTAAFLKKDCIIPLEYDLITHRSVFAENTCYASLSARARAVLNWRKETNYCGQCGSPLVDCNDESACMCLSCFKRYYPQNSPAIIVQVYKGEKKLLAHHVKHTEGLYTCIAGFLEPGETIEDCVKREVKEETSLVVDNVRYVESQAWPFPYQIMLGFTAEWVSGDIDVDTSELAHADWFAPDALPKIPTPGTLARRLISRER